LLLERVDHGSCEASVCAGQALEQANALLVAAPLLGAIELRSDALVRTERWQDAERTFVDSCPKLEGTELARCWFSRLALAQKKPGSSPAEISRMAKQAAEAACSALGQCSGWLREAGDVLRANRDVGGALNLYERAVQQSPSASLMLRIADAASALGLLARADAALGRAAQLAVGDQEQLRQIEAQREALRHQIFKQHRLQ
jgi:hypothetical protein